MGSLGASLSKTRKRVQYVVPDSTGKVDNTFFSQQGSNKKTQAQQSLPTQILLTDILLHQQFLVLRVQLQKKNVHLVKFKLHT